MTPSSDPSIIATTAIRIFHQLQESSAPSARTLTSAWNASLWASVSQVSIYFNILQCCICYLSLPAELYPHRNNHNYRVVDDLSFPILHPEWGADEEVLLLEAIDSCGLGNWEGVAELLGGNKGPAQCKQHYYDMYINVDSFPLPTPAPELANLSIQELKSGSLVPSSAPTQTSKRPGSSLNDPSLQNKSKAVKQELNSDAGAAGTSSQKEKRPRLDEVQVKSEQQQPPPLPAPTELSQVSPSFSLSSHASCRDVLIYL